MSDNRGNAVEPVNLDSAMLAELARAYAELARERYPNAPPDVVAKLALVIARQIRVVERSQYRQFLGFAKDAVARHSREEVKNSCLLSFGIGETLYIFSDEAPPTFNRVLPLAKLSTPEPHLKEVTVRHSLF